MKTFQQLLEGIYDPNIFKAVFLAGGPGSGKSFVVGRTLGGLGLKVINSDEPFERYLKMAGLSMRMPDSEQAARDEVRKKAKRVTSSRKGHAIDSRLGIIIDGTGKNYDKLTSQATQLKQIGYEVSMVFVNTSLETALARNEKRARKVPPRIAEQGWKDVQSNLGKFQQFFSPKSFFIVDNNDHQEDLMEISTKMIARAVRPPVNNPIATAWIADQMKQKGMSDLSNKPLGKNIGKGGGGYVPK
jgi:shikimate kinase